MKQVQHQLMNQRMSKIVIHDQTIYLSGQVGGDGATITEQTTEALHRVETLLKEAGSTKNHILQALVWLADMDDFDEMNQAWEHWFDGGPTPARACGEVKLARPELKVEVIVTAAKCID